MESTMSIALLCSTSFRSGMRPSSTRVLTVSASAMTTSADPVTLISLMCSCTRAKVFAPSRA